jgi:hypothetical protein
MENIENFFRHYKIVLHLQVCCMSHMLTHAKNRQIEFWTLIWNKLYQSLDDKSVTGKIDLLLWL